MWLTISLVFAISYNSQPSCLKYDEEVRVLALGDFKYNFKAGI